MINISKYLTPYKLNKPVITGSYKDGTFDQNAVDCPFVFYHQEQFHMLYVGFDSIGYQTAMATSDDLINWKFKGLVLPREDHVQWDKVGAAGTWILRNDDINQLPTLKKVDGKYWMIYHSYPGEGYETGPAEMGLAWCEDEDLLNWHRLDKPIFSWEGGADWEKGGLYKACLIENDSKYYMFYNAKDNPNKETKVDNEHWKEQTGVAISDDMLNWERYDKNPILKVEANTWESRFVSDPCVMRDGDKWVMFYFGYDGKHAQDGIAVSDDLLNWEKHPEPIIRYGIKGELDENHAHKPSIIKYDGILYHFYCACRRNKKGDTTKNFGKEFRCLTVATSKPL